MLLIGDIIVLRGAVILVVCDFLEGVGGFRVTLAGAVFSFRFGTGIGLSLSSPACEPCDSPAALSYDDAESKEEADEAEPALLTSDSSSLD